MLSYFCEVVPGFKLQNIRVTFFFLIKVFNNFVKMRGLISIYILLVLLWCGNVPTVVSSSGMLMHRFISQPNLNEATFSCTNDIDCNLNGQCQTTNNTCVCPGWTGPRCGQLDLLPAPLQHAFYRDTVASWGGSIVEENGSYYMFLAYILGNCGLNAWQPNSAIYRAVSSTNSPLGPYVNETEILSWFSHNPSVSKQTDGTLLVWHIGNGLGGGGFNPNCTNGTTPPPPPPPPVKIMNNNQCLVTNGTYPCFLSPQKWDICSLIIGDCKDPSALWSIQNNNINSATYSGASVNIDCNSCNASTVAKLFSAGASGITFNKTTGQLVVDSCANNPVPMCLSNGIIDGAQAPCGDDNEPWSPTAIHLEPCSSPNTLGWTIENTIDDLITRSLSNPVTSDTWPLPLTDVNVLISESGSVMGPFYQSGILQGNRAPFPYETDNPAPLVFANGSTWVMFRSWNPPGNTTTPIGIARSDNPTWNTTYTLTSSPVPIGPPNTTVPTYVPLEDPYLWQDQSSGTFHALFHNMGGCKDVGCHAFSEDGYLWYLAPDDPYTTLIIFQDNSNITYGRRERPHLVFNSLGQPAFLSNGVQETWSNDHSYTLVQPINVAWP